MVLFKNVSVDTDILITVGKSPPFKSVGVKKIMDRTGKIQGDWDPEREVAVVTTVNIPVEEALEDIGINCR